MGQVVSSPIEDTKDKSKGKLLVQSELVSRQAYQLTLNQQNDQLNKQLEISRRYSEIIPDSNKQIKQMIETDRKYAIKADNKDYRKMIFTADGEIKNI